MSVSFIIRRLLAILILAILAYTFISLRPPPEEDASWLQDPIVWHRTRIQSRTLPMSYYQAVKDSCLVDPVMDWERASRLNALETRTALDRGCSISPPTAACTHIPKVIHIIMGPKFKYYHYIGLKAAFDKFNPWVIYLYTDTHFPVSNMLFRRAVKEFNPVLIRSRDATMVHNVKIKQVEHKADVVRLELLLQYGGIYMDLDVFAFHPIDDLLPHNGLVIAPEDSRGLNNGFMMSKRCSTFVRGWYQNYTGLEDKVWNLNSIVRPLEMFREDARDARLETRVMVTWDNNTIFRRPAVGKSYGGVYCKHLFIRDKPQERLDLASVVGDDSDFGRVCRQILEGRNIT